jgi:hypothetical protein
VCVADARQEIIGSNCRPPSLAINEKSYLLYEGQAFAFGLFISHLFSAFDAVVCGVCSCILVVITSHGVALPIVIRNVFIVFQNFPYLPSNSASTTGHHCRRNANHERDA